ncbi:MAG TPA: glycine betaine ABC transporter substrate-binding protein [Solirubrobacteraceae bacterium]
MPCLLRTSNAPLALTAALVVLGLAGCGANAATSARSSTQTQSTTTSSNLPGTGKPTVTIGDKNFTEQFILGELYQQALTAQGYSVVLNQNIGPTEVTMRALQSGRLDMYPEYLNVGWQSSPAPWNANVPGGQQSFSSRREAYDAAQKYVTALGLELLAPTPFSDTSAVAVSFNYSVQNNLSRIGDLRPLSSTLTFGGPPQFEQSPAGLPAIERVYGVVPAAYKPLGVGLQYQALDQGTVQAADVNTTDGQLVSGNYTLLADPRHLFGWGNAVPVVSAKVLQAEGPAFSSTINRVSALLTISVIRQLNAAVDISGQDPKVVAQEFLASRGLMPSVPTS